MLTAACRTVIFCRHASYYAFARGIAVIAVSNATAVYEPFAPAATNQQAQNDALSYIRSAPIKRYVARPRSSASAVC